MRTDTVSSHLLGRDVVRLGTTGLRTRPTRAVLSALGIAIGIAAMIAVVGISASSRARLNDELAHLGTNMLTVSPGKDTFTGRQTALPADSTGRVRMIDGVVSAASTAALSASVYRSQLSNVEESGGITALVADQALLGVVTGHVRTGSWLNAATAALPTVVLGNATARRLGVVSPGTQIFLGGRYFTVVGILDPVQLVPDLDSAALVGAPIAAKLLGFDGRPTTVYERSHDSAVERIRGLLAPTLSPQAPDSVQVSRPSDALAAKNAADRTFTTMLIGLGSVALLVGGIGVANTMIISVLERSREIGLRRSLGATRRHILVQFLAEALLLSALGGATGCAIGAAVTGTMAKLNAWPFTLPAATIAVAIVAALVIGATAGFYPAVRAARTSPTAALSS
jgi:putative ABC transport system permease protein